MKIKFSEIISDKEDRRRLLVDVDSESYDLLLLNQVLPRVS